MRHNPLMRIGVDLGGTKIEAVALAADGAILHRTRSMTPAGDYAATLDTIAGLVHEVERSAGEHGTVGVAHPGAISPRSGLIKNSNSTVLNGRPLARDLAERLGRPVRLENDANGFALSEAVDGAGAGARVVFGVILGTGVGGGIVIERQVLQGHQKIAGEWGHCPLPWAGSEDVPAVGCYCGRSGCIETYLSGAGLARDYASAGGGRLDAAAIAAAAARGERAAAASLARYRSRLARGLAAILNVLDPDVIVLGGGLSNIQALYPGIAAEIARHTFSDGCETAVVPARHGDSSGVRGAAWLWPPGGDR